MLAGLMLTRCLRDAAIFDALCRHASAGCLMPPFSSIAAISMIFIFATLMPRLR